MARHLIRRGRHAVGRSAGKARDFMAARSGIRQVAAVSAGSVVGGIADAKWGEGTSTTIGVAGVLAGYMFKLPDAMNLSVGMLSPALYRLGLSVGSKYGLTPSDIPGVK